MFMLADVSTNTVNTGLPAGGGTGSSHVGFNRISSKAAAPVDISAMIADHRLRGIPAGRFQAYQPNNAAVSTTNATHKAGEITGSKVNDDM